MHVSGSSKRIGVPSWKGDAEDHGSILVVRSSRLEQRCRAAVPGKLPQTICQIRRTARAKRLSRGGEGGARVTAAESSESECGMKRSAPPETTQSTRLEMSPSDERRGSPLPTVTTNQSPSRTGRQGGVSGPPGGRVLCGTVAEDPQLRDPHRRPANSPLAVRTHAGCEGPPRIQARCCSQPANLARVFLRTRGHPPRFPVRRTRLPGPARRPPSNGQEDR